MSKKEDTQQSRKLRTESLCNNVSNGTVDRRFELRAAHIRYT